jgi:hypothetical protein
MTTWLMQQMSISSQFWINLLKWPPIKNVENGQSFFALPFSPARQLSRLNFLAGKSSPQKPAATQDNETLDLWTMVVKLLLHIYN